MELQRAMDPLGKMVSLIGELDFGAGFYRAADDLVGIDQCTVFICKEETPRMLVVEAQSRKTAERARMLADTYTREAYRSDPVWGTCTQAPVTDCAVFPVSPREITNESYRREFYEIPNIKHELVMTTMIGGSRIYTGFYREAGRPEFSADTIEMLRCCGRTMMQVLHKHADISARQSAVPGEPKPVNQKALLERVRQAILADNRSLTAREAEICASIVLGYTVLGISMNLGISINTVSTHRKRAYAKLRVCSQNELFARYFSVVEHNLGALRYN